MGSRLLLIDDDQRLVAMVGDYLRGHGYSVEAAANLRDEMEALGPVRLSDVQEAQKAIVATARKLSDEGAIVLAGRGGEQMV